MSTIRDLVATSLRELGIIDGLDPAPPEMATLGLDKINQILDEWNAQREAVYADVFSTFTLTPSLNPHTIGPSAATWTLTRPVSIEGAEISTDSGLTWSSLRIRDAAWFHGLSSPAETGDPRDLFYNPTAANGQLYFYPVPTSAYSVKLWTRIALADLTLDTVFSFPAGYKSALTATLKEKLTEMPMFASMQSSALERAAAKARATIFANNESPKRLRTAGSGIPGGRGAYFDWHTGELM